jgi:hypothetical protein
LNRVTAVPHNSFSPSRGEGYDCMDAGGRVTHGAVTEDDFSTLTLALSHAWERGCYFNHRQYYFMSQYIPGQFETLYYRYVNAPLIKSVGQQWHRV